MDTGQLYNVAYVAGREDEAIAQIDYGRRQFDWSGQIAGAGFRFSQRCRAIEGADSQVLNGVLVSKERLSIQMPLQLHGQVTVLVIDDALEQEELNKYALTTESGFQQYLILKEEFKTNIQKIIDAGAQAVFVDRGVDDACGGAAGGSRHPGGGQGASQRTGGFGRACGAKLLKRTGLNKSAAELQKTIWYSRAYDRK